MPPGRSLTYASLLHSVCNPPQVHEISIYLCSIIWSHYHLESELMPGSPTAQSPRRGKGALLRQRPSMRGRVSCYFLTFTRKAQDVPRRQLAARMAHCPLQDRCRSNLKGSPIWLSRPIMPAEKGAFPGPGQHRERQGARHNKASLVALKYVRLQGAAKWGYT